MSPIQELSCWEIMQCGAEECVARKNPDTPCWEVVHEMGYFQSTLNICKDCIVFVSKQNPPVLTARELANILRAQSGIRHAPALSGRRQGRDLFQLITITVGFRGASAPQQKAFLPGTLFFVIDATSWTRIPKEETSDLISDFLFADYGVFVSIIDSVLHSKLPLLSPASASRRLYVQDIAGGDFKESLARQFFLAASSFQDIFASLARAAALQAIGAQFSFFRSAARSWHHVLNRYDRTMPSPPGYRPAPPENRLSP